MFSSVEKKKRLLFFIYFFLTLPVLASTVALLRVVVTLLGCDLSAGVSGRCRRDELITSGRQRLEESIPGACEHKGSSISVDGVRVRSHHILNRRKT